MIDLKTKKITHQDVGQMDMYVRMYDEIKKAPDDNPTIGIVLCSETDEDISKTTTLVNTSNTDNIYSVINTAKTRTCGSGKKYKNCHGKNQ